MTKQGRFDQSETWNLDLLLRGQMRFSVVFLAFLSTKLISDWSKPLSQDEDRKLSYQRTQYRDQGWAIDEDKEVGAGGRVLPI